jgi:hypothetical protein
MCVCAAVILLLTCLLDSPLTLGLLSFLAEWMIVDHKQFTPGQPTRANTLWIASQIPGDVVTADVTSVLISQGYWASYNIPYFPDLWNVLGYESLLQQAGADGEYLWSYGESFRAQIFARDAPNVKTIEDMQAIIQENNWQTDPLSKGSADLAIASRMDLSNGPLNPNGAFGAIDAKLTAWSLMSPSTGVMNVLTKSGPTIETQPPFVWSTSPWASQSHVGLPDKFDFEWIVYEGLPAEEVQRGEKKEVAPANPAIALE